MFVLRVEQGLLPGEPLEIAFSVFLGRILGCVLGLIGRIKLVQLELLARFHPERLAVVQAFEPPHADAELAAGSIVMEK